MHKVHVKVKKTWLMYYDSLQAMIHMDPVCLKSSAHKLSTNSS